MAEEPSPTWKRLYVGPWAEVWIHEKCASELKDLNGKDRSKIEACMSAMYCQMENVASIPAERLNRNEHTHKEGHAEFRVQAFKHFQGRVYGVQGSVKGKRAFFATNAAVKKKDRADPKEFERAVRRLSGVEGFVVGAKV